jgi:hypothetical protein
MQERNHRAAKDNLASTHVRIRINDDWCHRLRVGLGNGSATGSARFASKKGGRRGGCAAGRPDERTRVLNRILLIYDETVRCLDGKQDLPPDPLRNAASIIRTSCTIDRVSHSSSSPLRYRSRRSHSSFWVQRARRTRLAPESIRSRHCTFSRPSTRMLDGHAIPHDNGHRWPCHQRCWSASTQC